MLDNYKKILVGIDGSVEATKALTKQLQQHFVTMLNSLSLTSLTFVPSNLSQPMIQLLLMIHTKVLKTSLMTLLTKQKSWR